jgi:NADH-quinone oxidoreductase subunit G
MLRLQLLSGNAQHLEPAAAEPLAPIGARRDLVLPAQDTLFTSGTLGKYSPMLASLQLNESRLTAQKLTQIDNQTAAD